MRVSIENTGYCLCPHCGSGECHPVSRLSESFWALQWLSHYRHQPVFMGALRRLCADLGYGSEGVLTDAAVLRLAAVMVGAGRLRVCKTASLATLETPAGRPVSAAPAPETPAAPVNATPAARTPAPVIAEPATFLPNADLLALAEAQKEAAKSGVPFCEECMKAKLARDRAATAAG